MSKGLKVGEVRIGRELVSDETVLRTDFYYDILKPADYRYAMGCVVDDTEDYNVGLSMNRSPKQYDFNDHDRQLISKLAPHLKRAVLLRNQLQNSQNQQHVLESSLHSLSSALAIVDARGRVCFINQVMDGLLSSQSSLGINNKKIVLHCNDLRLISFERICNCCMKENIVKRKEKTFSCFHSSSD